MIRRITFRARVTPLHPCHLPETRVPDAIAFVAAFFSYRRRKITAAVVFLLCDWTLAKDRIYFLVRFCLEINLYRFDVSCEVEGDPVTGHDGAVRVMPGR